MKNPMVRAAEVVLAIAGVYTIYRFFPMNAQLPSFGLWVGLWSQYGVTIAKGAGQ